MNNEFRKRIEQEREPEIYPCRVQWVDGAISLIWSDESVEHLLKSRWEACDKTPACGFNPISKLSEDEKRCYLDGVVVRNPAIISEFKARVRDDTGSLIGVNSIFTIKIGIKLVKIRFRGSSDWYYSFERVDTNIEDTTEFVPNKNK